MKKLALSLFAVCFLVAGTNLGQSGELTVTFDFDRRGGMATNQFAVWVEDMNGTVVKTLAATSFVAGRRGWQTRETALPVWVEASGVSRMNKAEMDAVSAATPSSGAMSYTWDGRDGSGKPVAPGEYRVLLEGTLRNDDQVLYEAVLRLGSGPLVLSPLAKYEGPGANAADRDMIANVKFSVIE